LINASSLCETLPPASQQSGAVNGIRGLAAAEWTDYETSLRVTYFKRTDLVQTV